MSRPRPPIAWSLLALLLLGSPRALRAEEESSAGKDPAEPKSPPTVTAEKGPFTLLVEATGAFAPVGAAEVVYEPEVLAGEFEVEEAFLGGPVEKDQVLVRLSAERPTEQVEGARREAAITRAHVSRQREEQRRAKAAAQAALEKAKVERESAERALAFFLEKNRDIRVKRAELSLQAARDNLQEQEEELGQLRKMYGSDDLVEETEEIVMRRAQRSLDRARINLGFQEEGSRQFLGWELPLEERNLRLAAEKEVLDHERLLATSDAGLEVAALELEKAQAALDRQAKALARLEADVAGLVLKAPRAGWAVPGPFAKGKWAAAEDTARLLEKKGKVRAGQVLFTVIEPGALAVDLSVPESVVLVLAPGQPAEVTVPADPALRLTGRVERVAPVSGDGSYDVRLALDAPAPTLRPGFAARAKIRAAERPDVVTVPVAAVGADGDKRLVHVVGEDGKPAPREVRVGRTSAGRVEVLDGLAGGEKVLKQAPKAP